ncbi:MAG: molybdopterin-dependent oxidoreductase, partial [Anaerovorax sp.]
MGKMRKNIVLISLMLLLLASVLFSGCQNDATSSKEYDYGQQEILITGLEEKEFTITVEELTRLDSVTEKAEANRFNGESVKIKAHGPTLNTFLKQYGKKQSDFAAIRFTASDQYAIAVPNEILQKRDIILTYADGGNPLIKEDQPLRAVIPGERAMYWVRMLKRIDFETEAGAAVSSHVVFLDNAVKSLPFIAYKDGTDRGNGVKTKALIEKYANREDVSNVYLTGGDGLKKNEIADTFLSAYVKYTGTDTPKYLAPHFPEGMEITNLLSFSYGDTTFYSLEEGMNVLKKREINGYVGIGFSDIIKEIPFQSGLYYIVTDGNQNQIKLTEEQLGQGVFYTQEGVWSFCYGDG